MSLIAPTTSVANRPHRVSLQNPGPPAPDGDGGFTQSWLDLDPPAVDARITPATAADLERTAAGTVISTATHVIAFPFHEGVTTQTRILYNGRRFNVTGGSNLEERNAELRLVCVEVVK